MFWREGSLATGGRRGQCVPMTTVEPEPSIEAVQDLLSETSIRE
jgi:hypothetical protein